MEAKIAELLNELGLEVISIRIDNISTHPYYPCRVIKGEVKTIHTILPFTLPIGLEDLNINVKKPKVKKPE